MRGWTGDDTLRGDGGNDFVLGGDGNDDLSGGVGEDYLEGNSGNDHLEGDAGDDTLWGNDGDDQMFGGSGDDLIFGGDGSDEIHGGDGADELWAGTAYASEDVIGDDTLYGDAGDDIMTGSLGNDTLYGGEGNDRLFSGSIVTDGGVIAASNSLYGEAGNDWLGGSGLLDGGLGNDSLMAAPNGATATTLTGGAGVDTFWVGAGYYLNDPANTHDFGYDTVTITDFDPATEVLFVNNPTETIEQSMFRTEAHGDDTWVVLSDNTGQEFVAAKLIGVSEDSIVDGSIKLGDRF